MDTLDALYKEMILDLYRNPLNKKQVDAPDICIQEKNPACGDEIELCLRFDEAGVLEDIGHQGQGCAISQAAVSLLTEEIKGKQKEDIKQFGEDQMMSLLNIPVSKNRSKCATLALKALHRALAGE